MLDVNVCVNRCSHLYLHGVPVREAHHDVDFFKIKGLWGEMQKQYISSQEKCPVLSFSLCWGLLV